MAVIVSERRERFLSSPVRHLDPLLFGSAALLAALGTLMIYASTRHRLEIQHVDPLYFVKRQVIAIVVGVVVMVGLMLIDYRRLRELSLIGYGATVLMLIVVLKFGVSVKGAQARFDIGAFQMQPGEFAKIFLTLVLAAYCTIHREEMNARRLVIALAICALPMGLIMLQPDLGTDVVLMAMAFTILLMAGTKARHLVVLLLLAMTLAVVAVDAGVLDQYQLDRLTQFDNNGADTQGAGYNQDQAVTAVGTGGLTGQGLFGGSQTIGAHVPEQHTDFIFTVVGEELGFVGGAFVLGLFAVIVWRTSRAARLAQDPFGMLVCMGVLAMFVAQVFENVGMATGIMPVTGIPLPFMSYGGSSVIVSFASIGLVGNVRMRRFS
ncbi:MAG: rod shape-determining protein RodA [Acidimicrobiia bacterium]